MLNSEATHSYLRGTPYLSNPAHNRNFSSCCSETEVSEDDLKVEIKSEANSECGSNEEYVKDINLVYASSGSTGEIDSLKKEPSEKRTISLSGNQWGDGSWLNRLVSELPPSKIRKTLKHCPFSVSLQCPICPKLFKGGLPNLPHLENHIKNQHKQHCKHLLKVVRNAKFMLKSCKCFKSGNIFEELFKHF